MASRGEATRKRILDATQEIILAQGYSNATVDRVLERTGLTKGAFFYHYKNKDELIRALIDRYAADEAGIAGRAVERAEALSKDPLQQLLIAIGFLIEQAEQAAREQADGPAPGCLFGSYAYEIDSFVPEVHAILKNSALFWRTLVREKLEQVATRHPPRAEVDLDALADGLLVAFEGGFIMGRMLEEPEQLARQLRNYRTYLELLFGLAS